MALESENALPPHVRTAFGVAEVAPRPVLWAGRRAWHCGEVLIRPVPDNALAAWSAGVLDGLHVEGVRLARPVRSSDGRWVVAGWAACRFVPGTLVPRYDATVEASLRLHAATPGWPAPASSTTATTSRRAPRPRRGASGRRSWTRGRAG